MEAKAIMETKEKCWVTVGINIYGKIHTGNCRGRKHPFSHDRIIWLDSSSMLE